MNMIFTTCFSVLFIVHSAVLQYRSVEAYYWRDFNGLIPSDAIKGGKDENGDDTYVAQFTTVATYYIERAKLHTMPAYIKKGSKKAIAAYSGTAIYSSDTTNTKVLCGIEYQFKWFSPSDPFPPNCRYVIGGNEDAYPMNVGRAHHNKEVVVGKIFPDDANHLNGLIIPYDGREVFPSRYEVLTYCP